MSLNPKKQQRCAWCGKPVCNKCLPEWVDWLNIKVRMENSNEKAGFEKIGFCSKSCSKEFWNLVMAYPLDSIGTNMDQFPKKARKLYYLAVIKAFNVNKNIKVRKEVIEKINRALNLETDYGCAIIMGMNHDGTVKPEWTRTQKSIKLTNLALASNLEKCGRPLDAAQIFENLLMYDKAKKLREKDKHFVVKNTAVSVNLNDLLKQVKDGGIVAVYRCPHCKGKLKLSKETTMNSLRTCEYCGTEIEALDLIDFLHTVLS